MRRPTAGAAQEARQATGVQGPPLKPLYDLRVSDLSDTDAVVSTCACGHEGEVSGAVLKASKAPPFTWITGKLGIKSYLKCRGCGERGKAVWVSVRRGGAKA